MFINILCPNRISINFNLKLNDLARILNTNVIYLSKENIRIVKKMWFEASSQKGGASYY